MKILFIDALSPIGHKNYDYGILKQLIKIAEVDVLARRDFLNLNENGIKVNSFEFIPDEFIPEIIIKKSKSLNICKLKIRIKQYKFIKWIKKNLKLKKYDLILFSSVEILSFAIATHNISTKIIFINHEISDIDDSYIKKFFWKKVNKNIDLIVMEPYIKEYMEKQIKIKNKIHLLPHPLPSINTEYYNKLRDKRIKKVIFAPSLSNDENFIDFLIKNKEIIPKEYIIILKSKRIAVDFENIKVYNSRISDEEYYSNMVNSSYVLLPYDDKYNYKISGVLYEAVFFKKQIIINNNNTLKNYQKTYSEIVLLFNGYNDFIDLIERLKDEKEEKDSKEFEEFLYNYSDEVIKKRLEIITKQYK